MNIENKSCLSHPDFSLDTTLNTTDLSASQEISEALSTDEEIVGKSLFKDIHKQKKHAHGSTNKYLEQMRNNVSKLNVKLQEKTLQLESIKSEYAKKAEQLEINLNKFLHENELLKVQLHVEREENKVMKNSMEIKLSNIESRQSQLQATSQDIQRIFVESLQLTEAQYNRLKSSDRELSLADFISVKLYEKTQEWKDELSCLKLRNAYKDEELHSLKISCDKLQDDLESERRQKIELELKLERSKKSYDEITQQAHWKNFKVDNYDTLQKEKDDLEAQLSDVSKKLCTISLIHDKDLKDMEEHFSELVSAKQSMLILKHDKEYLTKVLNEQEGKLLAAEVKINQLEQQLAKIKQAREDIYEKHMISREQYRAEYEEKLKKELEQMRIQMDLEIDKLKANVKEVSEREARSLEESRDLALNERDRALMLEREVMAKYEQILLDFRHHQLSDGNTISDLNNQLKMKSFELEKVQLLYNESMKSIKESQLSYEKLQRKMEILLKEYHSLQTNFERKVTNLEATLKEKSSELEGVEKFISNVENIIVAKDDAKSHVTKDIKDSFQNGIMGKSTQERLMACVNFIKKKAQMNKSPIHSLKSESKQLANSQYNHLTAELDAQISMLKQELSTAQLQHRALQKENSRLVTLNNQMSSDLKSLLDQEEEMAAMKKIIEDIKKKSRADSKDLTSPKVLEKKSDFGTP